MAERDETRRDISHSLHETERQAARSLIISRSLCNIQQLTAYQHDVLALDEGLLPLGLPNQDLLQAGIKAAVIRNVEQPASRTINPGAIMQVGGMYREDPQAMDIRINTHQATIGITTPFKERQVQLPPPALDAMKIVEESERLRKSLVAQKADPATILSEVLAFEERGFRAVALNEGIGYAMITMMYADKDTRDILQVFHNKSFQSLLRTQYPSYITNLYPGLLTRFKTPEQSDRRVIGEAMGVIYSGKGARRQIRYEDFDAYQHAVSVVAGGGFIDEEKAEHMRNTFVFPHLHTRARLKFAPAIHENDLVEKYNLRGDIVGHPFTSTRVSDAYYEFRLGETVFRVLRDTPTR